MVPQIFDALMLDCTYSSHVGSGSAGYGVGSGSDLGVEVDSKGSRQ